MPWLYRKVRRLRLPHAGEAVVRVPEAALRERRVVAALHKLRNNSNRRPAREAAVRLQRTSRLTAEFRWS